MRLLHLAFYILSASLLASNSNEEIPAPMHLEPGYIFTVRYGNEEDQNWSYRVYKIIEFSDESITVYCFEKEFEQRPISIDSSILAFQGIGGKTAFGYLRMSEAFLRTLLPQLASYSTVTPEELTALHTIKPIGLWDDIVVPSTKAEIEEMKTKLSK